jgi:signal peptidase I
MKIKTILKWADPFTYLDIFLLKLLGEPKKPLIKIAYWIAYIIFAFVCAYIIYLLLGLILGVNMPLAIVVSYSMEPSLSRGDIVIIKDIKNLDVQTIEINENIKNKDLKEFAEIIYFKNEYGLEQVESITIDETTINIENIIENDIIIYPSNLQNKDIVHRLVVLIKANDGEYVLTKGDNNKTNRLIDQDCNFVEGVAKHNCLNKYPTPINKVKGKVISKIPYIGYIKLGFFNS